MAPLPVVLLTLEERIRRFGVTSGGPIRRAADGSYVQADGIVFRGGEWEAGGEYVQKLTVKNVSTKIRKLKYRLPTTRYFTLAFPETIELSPGMSREIDVVFRPVLMETYDDTIYFKLEEQPVGADFEDVPLRGFHVPVRALLSTLQATVPEGLDFGLCPAAETSERVFQIVNTGQVPAPFEWNVPAPFRIEPMRGVVGVGESVAIVASVRPTCEVGRGINAIKPQPVLEMKLSAIGKYPHIVLSESRVDFGDILVGTPTGSEDVMREVTITNQSVVPATVRVLREAEDCDAAFSLYPDVLIVPPHGEATVRCAFAARSAGNYSADHYSFVTPGGNKPQLLLTGTATSPQVSVFKKEDPYAHGLGVPNSVNFGAVEVGHACSRAVFLKNESDLATTFQFVLAPAVERGATFVLSQYSGVLPAKLQVPIKIVFSPDRPINYSRRVFILIQNRAPLFIDVIGTAYIPAQGQVKEQRPAPLRHAHLQAARNRAAAGLGRASPDELALMLDEYEATGAIGAVSGDDAAKLFSRVGAKGHDAVLRTTRVPQPVTRSGEATRDEIAAAHDFFDVVSPDADGDASERDVHISTLQLDFGACRVQQSSLPTERRRTVTITNATHAKVCVFWRVPSAGRAVDDDGALHEAETNVSVSAHKKPKPLLPPDFVVTPATGEIAAGRSMEFRVEFKPTRSNVYSFVELEAVTFFKSQRSFRLVNDALQAPPWSFAVLAAGHSFTGEQFSPQLTCEPSRCNFPGTFVGDATFQTLKLTNRSNLPALYSIEPDEVSRVFSVEPSRGFVPAGGFQLVVAKFEPKAVRAYKHVCRLVVNGEPADGPVLVGHGHVPWVLVSGLEGGDYDGTTASTMHALTFQPTSVGLHSKRCFEIRNTSRVPLVYAVAMPSPRMNATFVIKPRTGVLQGKERARVEVTFSPRAMGVLRTKAVVSVRALAGPPPGRADTRFDARQCGDAAPAPVVQKLTVRLVAPGACGVVFFDPPELDFPTLLVNTTESQYLVLSNGADCAIEYTMDYTDRSDSVGDDSVGAVTRTNLSHIFDGTFSLKSMPVSGRSQRILVDEPRGILPARSRKKVKVTFQPDSAGDFEFAAVCRVHAVDADGRRVVLDPAEAALLSLGDTAQGPAAEAAVQAMRVEGMPLSCVVRGRASFPTVIMRDVRLFGHRNGCSTQALWAAFSLARVNASLVTPLTGEEVAFNLLSSPDLEKLERFPLRFVPDALGAATQVVLVDVTNPGSLATSFSIHLPNERDVELESWASEGEPTEADVKVNRIIDELKCFDVTPRHALLRPGESVTLRFAYAFSSRDFGGEHTLPVLLRVAQGKQMWLELRGKTLAPQEPLLLCETEDPTSRQVKLHPVAVGTEPNFAPLQCVLLTNVADVDVDYDVELEQPRPVDEKYTTLDVGVELLRLENARGTIFARSTVELRLRFLPLMPCAYTAKMGVQYRAATPGGASPKTQRFGERSLETTLTMAGYDAAHLDPWSAAPPPFSEAPKHQVISPRGDQVAVLSQERLRFGRLPQRAVAQQLVTLRPSDLVAEGADGAEAKTFDFQWEAAHDLIQRGVLDISPLSGSISPGDVAVCRVTVRGECEPAILEAAVLCLIRERAPPPVARRMRGGTSQRKSSTATLGTARSGVTGRSSTARSEALGSQAAPLGPRLSIVSRCTVSRERFLTQTMLPHDRLPMMPSGGSALAPPPLGEAPADASLAETRQSAGQSLGGHSAATVGTGLPPTPGGHTYRGRGKKADDFCSPLASPTAGSVKSLFTVDTASNSGYGDESAKQNCFVRLVVEAEIVSEAQNLDLHGGRSTIDDLYIPRPLKFIPPLDFGGEHDGAVAAPANECAADASERPDESRAKEAARTSCVRAALSGVFNDLLRLHEVRTVFQLLPCEPSVPFYFETKPKVPILGRIFGRIDSNGDGVLTFGELKDGLQSLGVKARIAEVKDFFRALEANRQEVVDLQMWSLDLAPNVVLAIEDAVDSQLHLEAVQVMEARDVARMQRRAAEHVSASTKMQSAFRRRTARNTARMKKEARTDERQAQDKGALAIQSRVRARASTQEAKQRAVAQVSVTARTLLANAQFQASVHAALEGTVFNLLQEALYAEFDLAASPIQRVLPNPARPPPRGAQKPRRRKALATRSRQPAGGAPAFIIKGAP